MPKPADFPLPDTDDELTRAFWAGAARGELVLPRCDGCGEWVWYPRPACPACGSDAVSWVPVSGRGRLFSWAVVRRAFLPQFAEMVPYVTALVCPDEAPAVRLATTLVDCRPEELAVDQPVHAVFRPLSFPGVERQVTAPLFTPTPV